MDGIQSVLNGSTAILTDPTDDQLAPLIVALKEQEERFENRLTEQMEECKKMAAVVAEKDNELQKASASIQSLEETSREKVALQASIDELNEQLNGEHIGKVDLEARLDEALAQVRRNDMLDAVQSELVMERSQLEKVEATLQKLQEKYQATASQKDDLTRRLHEFRHARERMGTVSEKLKRSKMDMHKIREAVHTYKDSGAIPVAPENVDDLDEDGLRGKIQSSLRAQDLARSLCEIFEARESHVSAPTSNNPDVTVTSPSVETSPPSSPLSDPPDTSEDDLQEIRSLRVTIQSPESGIGNIPEVPTVLEERKTRRGRQSLPASILSVRGKSQELISTSLPPMEDQANGKISEAPEEQKLNSQRVSTRAKGRGRGKARGRGRGRVKPSTGRNAKTAVRDRYTTPVRGKPIVPVDNAAEGSDQDGSAHAVIRNFHGFQEAVTQSTHKRTGSQSGEAGSSKKSKLFGELELTENRDEDEVGDLQHTSPHFPGGKSDPKTGQRKTPNSKVKKTYSKVIVEEESEGPEAC